MPSRQDNHLDATQRSRTARRAFLSSLVTAAVSPLMQGADGTPPNFVLIYADDLGYGDLGCYGSRSHATPHIDRMAADGVRFTSCYSPTPYCAPSRASLLTGRYPFRHGLMTNPAPDGGINDAGLAPEEITIPEVLKSKGYASTCIGKWHLGHVEQFLPRRQGFDEYYGILYSNDMRPVQLVTDERVTQYPVVQSELTRDYTSRAIDFMRRRKTRPFFLYLPHAMPHKPLAASEAFYPEERPAANLYAHVMRELDWSVGRVLQTIAELGLESNTLVIFASDNGPWYGGSTAGLRGMKATNWEGGIRVPLLARWPGRIPRGLVSHEICGVFDMFPTLCGLAGAPLPTDRVLDGRDLWPLMTKPAARSPHEAIFSMNGTELNTIRSGRWKLHVRASTDGGHAGRAKGDWVDPRGPDGVTIIAPYEQARPSEYPGLTSGPAARPMMLFDLERDPGEQNDVAASHPDVVAQLKQTFDRMQRDVPSPTKRSGHRPRVPGRLTGGELRYDRLPAKPE